MYNNTVENTKYVRRMVKDLNNNKSVYIGFCGRQDDDFVEKLQGIHANTDFAYLITPIVDQGEDGGDIKFTKLASGLIKAEIKDLGDVTLKEVTLSLEQFKKFADLTVDFAGFMCDNGNKELNLNI